MELLNTVQIPGVLQNEAFITRLGINQDNNLKDGLPKGLKTVPLNDPTGDTRQLGGCAVAATQGNRFYRLAK